MRIFFLSLLLASCGHLFAQAAHSFIFSLDVPFLGSTETISANRVNDNSDLPIRVHPSLGYELLLRKPDRQFAPVTGARVGYLFNGNFANSFVGRGVQLTGLESPVPVESQLYGQARLLGAVTGELSLGAEIGHDPNLRNLRFYVGGGLLVILHERVQATTSWINPDPENGFSRAACCGRYDEVDGRIQQTLMESGAPGAGNLFLSQTMLNQFIPYLEARFSFQAGANGEMVFGLQVGVLPAVDKSWYNTEVRGGSWIAVRSMTRGIF